MSAAPAEYPQIRPMFADALKAMAEGETEAEKQIVYVLNEARAALPCPSFVAGRTLYVLRGGEAVGIVSVADASDRFEVTSMIGNGWEMAEGTLALAHAVARALKSACVVIALAAMEAGPKVMRVEQSFSMSPEGMSREVAACFAETAKARKVATAKDVDIVAGRVGRISLLMSEGLYRDEATVASLAEDWGVTPDTIREYVRQARSRLSSAGFAGVSPGPVSREVAPGETVKSADVLVLRARSKVLEMRRLYSPGDSDFRAGVKEACDAIGEALDMAPAPKPPTA